MPYAPTYTSQTGGAQGSNTRFRAFDNGGGILGGVATGLQQGGNALVQYAQAEDEIQQKHDDLFSRREAARYRQEVNAALSEYSLLEGDDAITQAEPTRERLRKLREDYLTRLAEANPRMQRFFDERTLDFSAEADSRIVNRSLTQQREMEIGVLSSEINEVAEQAVDNWTSPEVHTSFVQGVSAKAGELADAKGLEGDLRRDFVRSYTSKARLNTIQRMLLDDDVDAALAYVEAYGDEMTPGDETEALKVLQEPRLQRWAEVEFNEISSLILGGASPTTEGGAEGGNPGTAPAQMPVDGRITSNFAAHSKRGSAGLDIAAPAGSPILAVAGGEVIEAGNGETGGNFIRIRQPDGYTVSYMHMAEPSRFKAGDQVTRSDMLGPVGSTGRATGPHLHIEVKDADGNQVDPEEYLRGSVPVGSASAPRNWDRARVYDIIDQRRADGKYTYEQAERLRQTADVRIARDERLLAEREADAADAYATWLEEGTNSSFTDFNQIPEHIRQAMSPQQRLQAISSAKDNRSAVASQLGDATKTYLTDLSKAEPEAFAAMDLSKYVGMLEQDDYASLRSAQNTLREKARQESVEWSPNAGIRTAFNLGKSTDVADYETEDELAIRALMTDWAYRRFQENGGKPLTTEEYNMAYRYAVAEAPANVSSTIGRFLGLDPTREQRPRYKIDQLVERVTVSNDQTQAERDRVRRMDAARRELRVEFIREFNREPTPAEMIALLEEYDGN